MKINFILTCIVIVCCSAFIIKKLTVDSINSKCHKAYNNYVSYMDKVNEVAIPNGFGAQHIDSLETFCKK